MSRTISAKTTTSKPRTGPPRMVGRAREGTKWRCPSCTFLTEGDVCTMCQAEKPSQPRANLPAPHHPAPKYKPRSNPSKVQQLKTQNIVYEDPTDKSVNVPIAGIKKYQYEPARKQNQRKNYVGMLQDAASDEPMPCMRKKK